MKKILCSILVIFILTISLTVPVAGADEIPVFYNGVRIVFDVNPIVSNGRTLVPMRAIFETFGATVDYNSQTKQITAIKGSLIIILKIGNTYATITKNGSLTEYTLDAAPLAVDGRTVVPLRFIGEALGATVNWNGTTRTVTIISSTSNPPPAAIAISAIKSISGIAKVGVELTAGILTPLGATVSYQWKVCSTENGTYTNVTGATTNKYTPVEGDVGKYIKVAATGTGSYTGTVTSVATATVSSAAQSTAYGFVVSNRAQLLELLKIAILDLNPEILFDIRFCDDNSYSDIQNIFIEASVSVELEKGMGSIVSSWEWNYNALQMTVKIEYYYTQDQLRLTEIKAASIVENIINGKYNMSDYEKELAIHDYIVNNTVYDYDNYISGIEPIESHTAYGVLVLGTAVCDGYANAMSLLCNLADIECLVVVGYAGGSHAWNIVKIDGQYYQVDVTWDDPASHDSPQMLQHHYFNITDEKMMSTHTWVMSDYPQCVSTKYNYYYMNNLVAKDIDDFKIRLQNTILNKRSGIELLIEDYTSEAYQGITDIIYNIVFSKDSTASYYYWSIDESLGIINIHDIEYR